uniref:Uncharacterized protein n=1 Tax=Salmo trutta TaxID=8032 RepID=A0A673Y7V9_SALTR
RWGGRGEGLNSFFPFYLTQEEVDIDLEASETKEASLKALCRRKWYVNEKQKD